MASKRTRWAPRLTRVRAIALVCGAVGLGSGVEGAIAAPPADRVLHAAQKAQEAGSAHEAAEPTIELRDLALALPRLDGAEAREARAILARPPEGTASFGGAWPAGAEEKMVETTAYVVHYAEQSGCDVSDPGCDEPNLTDGDLNGIPDYVDAAIAAMNASIAVENGELGWPSPKGDGQEGEPEGSLTGDRLDIYLSDLCGASSCVFGYASPDDSSASCTSPPFRCNAYLVLDNDYSEFGSSGGELGLRVTTAHEYNHILQYNLDANQDSWMLESTATWSEEQVFPVDDDWVRSYSDYWAGTSQVPVTRREFRTYGSAVWNHWLERGDGAYGPDVILNAWQSSRNIEPKDYAVGAYDNAIKDEGGLGFPEEFAKFAAATAEWRTGDGDFPDAAELADVKRLGTLGVRGDAAELELDNTSYAMFNVNPKDARKIELRGTASPGVQWAVALVGRDGGRLDGDVTRRVEYSDGGEQATAALPSAQSFERITAVVTNADGRVTGPKSTFGQFTYENNDERFRLKLREP